MGAPDWVDVFPIKNGEYSIAMLVYQRVNMKNIPAPSKGCQLIPKGWWIDTL